MIRLEGRRLIVPEEERILGIRADNGAERRVFVLPAFWEDGAGGQIDLRNRELRLWYALESGSGDSGVISRAENGEEIRVVWEIDDRVTSEAGRVLVHLQWFDGLLNMQTEETAFEVGRVRTDYEEIAEAYPSELQSWERRMAALEEDARRAEEYAAQAALDAGAAAGSAEAAARLAQQRADDAEAAETAAETAQTGAADSAEDAEAWAVGQRGGADVSGDDETWHNNAKYWSEVARQAAGQGSGDMLKADYDADADGIVDDAEKLGGQLPTYYASAAELTGHEEDAPAHVSSADRAAWNAKQAALTFDSAPAAGSANPVTSGGIKTALDGKAEAVHASRHASGGSDPITPASVGAVARSGDTMTGTLIAAADSTPTAAKIRNSSLNATEVTPAANGEIAWQYA